jgi:hypothetical protein
MLREHRSYRDGRARISEEFLRPDLGYGRTVAVVARPLDGLAQTGFVMCHAFGMEQMHLSRDETRLARALAAAGFPTLRIHGQGYGDSDQGMPTISLSSHLRDARVAAELLVERTGVSRVGAVGSRLGGTVAALIADERQLPLFAAIEPIVAGAHYMRDFLRTELFSSVAGEADDDFFPARSAAAGTARGHAAVGVDSSGASSPDLRGQLADQGWADIKGFPLSRTAYEEISAIDLTSDVRRFRGRSVLIVVSRTGKPSVPLARLARHLETLGGATSLEVVTEPQAASFGQYHYGRDDRTGGKLDSLFQLRAILASTVTEWAVQAADGGRAASDATVSESEWP